MEVYRWEDRKFGKLEPLRFGAERDFEDLLEKDATLILGEPLCVISRQPPLSTSKQKIDLLALDRQGNSVIIDLKRGKPSRTAITQILEYAAGVSQLSFIELEQLAYRWCLQHGKEFSTLTALHSEFFGYEPGDIRKSAFNQRQRLVLISEGVDTRVLEVAEYLRALGLDLTYISYFSYHAPDEILVATETVLGGTVVKEQERSYDSATQQFMTLTSFIETLQVNEELLQIANEFLAYVDTCGATLRPRIAKLRMTIGGCWWLDTYPSRRATHFRVDVHGDFTPLHIVECRANLPNVTVKNFGISFNIATKAHLDYAIEIFERVRNSILSSL
ncbi:hypothetical protein F4Y19_19500 [Candidatus Poribacteria bacterium]|nr:hypothetical protein [Candidatus Poribacteria bacterium]